MPKFKVQNHPGEQDKVLFTEIVNSPEGKTFFIDVKENARGVAVNIRERRARGQSDRIMIPAEILSEVMDSLEKVEKFLSDNLED